MHVLRMRQQGKWNVLYVPEFLAASLSAHTASLSNMQLLAVHMHENKQTRVNNSVMN